MHNPPPMKFTTAAAVLSILGMLFMDTPSRKNNRLQDRMNTSQINEAIITINHLQSPIQ